MAGVMIPSETALARRGFSLAHSSDGADTGTRPLALLIVDDERDLTEEIAEAARYRGYIAHVANSAEEALRLLEQNAEIGVMLTDIRMPRIDGLQLSVQVMRTREDMQALEVVIMTGHATLDDAIVALRVGAFDFVRKPFRFPDLFDVISRAMGRALGRRMLSLQQALPSLLFDTLPATPCGDEAHGSPTAAAESLLAALMHEARTPLVPILGFSELLDSDPFAPDVREFARHIKTGAHNLQALISDLIMLARVESGALPPQPVPLLPDDLLRDVAANLVPVAQLTRVALDVGPPGAGRLRADATMLNRALMILTWIAIQCTGRDKAVTLSTQTSEAGTAFHIRSGSVFGSAEERASDAWRNVMQVSPLGIRLVVAIASRHGGSLILHKPEAASFDATLTLPTAA